MAEGGCLCGAVRYRLDRPAHLDVTLASLDDPALFAPEEHNWTMSRIRWFEVRDELPRHAGARSA